VNVHYQVYCTRHQYQGLHSHSAVHYPYLRAAKRPNDMLMLGHFIKVYLVYYCTRAIQHDTPIYTQVEVHTQTLRVMTTGTRASQLHANGARPRPSQPCVVIINGFAQPKRVSVIATPRLFFRQDRGKTLQNTRPHKRMHVVELPP